MLITRPIRCASSGDRTLALSQALRQKGMWENTLLVYTSDNGGPAGRLASGHSGNNFPLRGGKTNFFEGGVRVSSFLGGGALPASIRGQHRSGYMYGSFWLGCHQNAATFARCLRPRAHACCPPVVRAFPRVKR